MMMNISPIVVVVVVVVGVGGLTWKNYQIQYDNVTKIGSINTSPNDVDDNDAFFMDLFVVRTFSRLGFVYR